MSRLVSVPVRWSWLRAFAQSAAHALHAALHGKDPTPCMKLGTYGHAAAFEPHRLVVFAPGEFTDKKGKTRTHAGVKRGEAFEQFKKGKPADAIYVTPKEMARAQGIAAALRRADAERVHPDTGEPLPLLFGPGVVLEQQILWERNGRACSSIPDARLPGRRITDLKVARSGDPERYPRDAGRHGYQGQLVMYDEADAYERTGDHRNVACELYSVVVEPYEPYVVTTYRLTASAYSSGADLLARWWSQLASCEAVDHWPGYVQAVQDFHVDDPLASMFGLEPDSASADDAIDVDTYDPENDNSDAGADGVDDWSAA